MNVSPGMKLSPRVLIVDNDPRTRESLGALISHWGYIPIIAEGEGDVLVEDAKDRAKAHRCQVAIVDIRLIDDLDVKDKSGLDLVQQLKPALSSIVTSAFGNAELVSESLEEKGASAFVTKESGPKVLKDKLEKVICTVCAANKNLVIEPLDVVNQVSSTLFNGGSIQFSDQFVDILSRLFSNVDGLRIEKLSKDYESSDISTVPRPKSVILKVYERIGENEMQPVLVKIARTKKIIEEVSRYKAHIRRQLVGLYTASLEDSTCAWDIGGAIYSYFGNADVIPFSQYFQKESAEKIIQCLKHFFTTTWSAHYQKIKVVTNGSLYEHYCRVWGDEWYDRVVKFQDLEVGPIMGQERWEKIQAPHPIEWLVNLAMKDNDQTASLSNEILVAVTHGDLHGDNILVDENNIAWVIDFERTGEGHALQDFVELESDIINRLKCTRENSSAFYQLCLVITKQDEIQALNQDEITSTDLEVEKALQIISAIRSLAREATNISNFQEYLFGLLFNTIFRATITPDDPLTDHQKRALMLASIICHRLDHWNDPWPPEEWRELNRK
jgi:DNA-binding response OmpR family regulator